jgi:protoporphyrinogen/coproporphyrinogen III oxidase
MKRVVIVGGGITGLATALHLRDGAAKPVPGALEVVVLEAATGRAATSGPIAVDGFVIEAGPTGSWTTSRPRSLVRRLGLDDQLQRADESAARRFLFRNGRLHLLPSGPLGFLRSPVLSGAVGCACSPSRSPTRRPPGATRACFDFAARRIGPEAASVLVDAMVSGVFAGNVHELSLRSAFPKMAGWRTSTAAW